MRATALMIMAVLPLTLGIWVLSITVPVAIEARRAADKIFVDPVDREHLHEQAPTAPDEMPSSVSAVKGSQGGGPTATAVDAPTPPPTATETTVAGESGERPESPQALASPTLTPTPYPEWDGDDPLHVLLMGVDERPSDNGPGLSDTIIVVRVDPEMKRVDMFSIPRDLTVTIPGFEDDVKINNAYPWGEDAGIPGGGPSLMAQTIEYNFGVPIDYFATVNIPGLEKIIDTLGGVVVDVEVTLKDEQYPTEDFGVTRAMFPAGLQKLNGEQAVRYARTRHADSDFMRSIRQQQVLLAIREQSLNAGLLTNLPELIAETGDAVRTDLSIRQVLSLARLAQDIPRENIYSHSLVPYTTVSDTSAGWFLYGDWEALRWVVQHLPEDPNATNNPGG
jgi:polyisoprenyl-teichoic acid--peptidoglycan teichoic acid transferase